jgi:hypothetical protein
MDFLLHTQLYMYLLVVLFKPHSPYLLHNRVSRLGRYHITCRLNKGLRKELFTPKELGCVLPKIPFSPPSYLSYPIHLNLASMLTKPKTRSLPLNPVFFFLFLFSILCCCHIGNHPQEGLAIWL